jgi:hypothetical protein
VRAARARAYDEGEASIPLFFRREKKPELIPAQKPELIPANPEPNPAATADIAALCQACRIIERARLSLLGTDLEAGWEFLNNAERYLDEQRAAAFRYLFRDG